MKASKTSPNASEIDESKEVSLSYVEGKESDIENKIQQAQKGKCLCVKMSVYDFPMQLLSDGDV